jgi:hypothetical protein
MRLIDADALMEQINDCVFTADMTTTIAVNMACRWIDNAPTIEPEPHWIPCSERLPDAPLRKTGDEDFEWFESEQVLICDKDGLIHVAYIVKDYIFNDIYWRATDVDELRGEEVKAWMPLPAPYKEDTE